MKEKNRTRLSIHVLTPILVGFHLHLACRVDLQKSHGKMSHNLYLKSSKGEIKAHGRKSAFIKMNGASAILVAYYIILKRTQDSPIGRHDNFRKCIVKTTCFRNNKNNGRVNRIKPRRQSVLQGIVNTFL